MRKTKKIVSLVLALSMVFGYSANIIPSFAINSVKNNIVQKATAADNDYRIIAVGDSITYGAGTGGRVAKPYPTVLQEQLNAMAKAGDGTGTDSKTNVSNFVVTNNGINSMTMLSSGNMPYINNQVYTNTCNNAKDTDAIIIMLGTNDAKAINWSPKNGKTAEENYTADAIAMVNRFKLSNPNVRIIFATAAKSLVTGTGTNDINKDTVNNKVAPLQRELAIMNGWELVDINKLTKDWTATELPDSIHPSVAGYATLAGFMKNAINDDGTISSTNKINAVVDFITALPAATAITDEATATAALAAYNRAQKTFDMLKTAEKSNALLTAELKTKLTDVKAAMKTHMGATSEVTVQADINSGTQATTSATFAKTGDKVTLTATKSLVSGTNRFEFDKWVVSPNTVKLDDYITETTTFTKGAEAVTIVPSYKRVALTKPTTGSEFDDTNRFILPAGTSVKEFEAENMVLVNNAPAGETAANAVKAIADRSSSGDLAVTNFNAGDKLELSFGNAKVGQYTIGITYRSLVTPFPGTGTKPEHGFNISTGTASGLSARYLTLTPTRAGYTDNVVYYTSYFELDVPAVAADKNGKLTLTAETDNVGLVIDKFTIIQQDSYVVNAVGDSISFGDTASAYDKFAFQGSYTSYPHKLQHILNNKIASGEIAGKDNFIVANMAIPGATMLSNGAFPYGDAVNTMTTPTYRSSLGNKADAVIVMLGTNDATSWTTVGGVTPEKSFTDSAVKLMKSYTDARTGLATPTELYFATSPKTKITTERPLLASTIVPLQRKIAADNTWNIIDIADKTKDWGASYYADNVHPNLLGYDALAEYMADGFINKVQANNVALGNLFSTVTLFPAFNPQVTSYKATTSESKISLTAVASIAGDKIKIEKGTVSVVAETVNMADAKDIVLADGENVYTITVTAIDGKTKVYTVTVTKTDALAYVSDLPWPVDTQGNGGNPNRRDLSCADNVGDPIQLNTATTGTPAPSKVYAKGVGIHGSMNPNQGCIVVQIPDGATNFKSTVGAAYRLFSKASNETNIKFKVFFGTSTTAFDAAAYTSDEMSAAVPMTSKEVDVTIPTGKTYMKLAVSGVRNAWSAHGNWADARFTVATPATPTDVSEVAVPTIAAPANGDPQTQATVETTKNYTAYATIWKNGANVHIGDFAANNVYTAEIILKAKIGFKFTDTVTITGNTTTLPYTAVVSTDKSTVTLTKTFANTTAVSAKLSALTSTVPFKEVFAENTLNYTSDDTMQDITTITATAIDTVSGVVVVKNNGIEMARSTAGGTVTTKVPLTVGNNSITIESTSSGSTATYTIAINRLPSTNYISDLPWVRNVAGHAGNPNQHDRSVNGTVEKIQLNTVSTPLTMKEYEKGVGIHGATTDNAGYITVAIPDGAKKFQADVGVAYQRFIPIASAASAKLTFTVTFGTAADIATSVAPTFTTAKKMVATRPATGESNTFEKIDIAIPENAKFMKLKVSGANAAAIGGGHGNWADAKFIGATTINSAVINLVAPETGVASTDATVSATENYTATSTTWKEGTNTLTVPALFEAAKTYDVTVVLTAKTGYRFTADAKALGYDVTIGADADGNTMTLKKTYTATLATNANLSAFSSTTATVSPAFGANVLNYTASTASDKITLTATAADAAGRVVINNNGAKALENTAGNTTTGDVTLAAGDNVITAVVTNGSATKTYTLTVTKLLDHTYISDLEWLASVSGWDGVTNKKDLAANKDAVEKIQLNASATMPFVSKEYGKGVGLHASTVNSKGYVVVAIPEGYTKFQSDVGVAFQRFRATGNESAVSVKAYVYFDTTQAGVVGKTTDATYVSEKSLTAKRAPAAATEINTFYPIDVTIPNGAKFMKIQAFGANDGGGHVNFANAQFATANATIDMFSVLPVVKAPVTGDNPTNAIKENGRDYTVTSTTWKQGTTTVANTDTFAVNTVYDVEVVLTANAGYSFAQNTTATGYDVTVASDGSTVTLKKIFDATVAAPTSIDTAKFDVTAPITGSTSSNATVEAAANYTVLSTTWFEVSTDSETQVSAVTFKPSTVYKVVVKLQAKPTFRFKATTTLDAALTGYSTPAFDTDLNVMTVEKTFTATELSSITSVGINLAAPVTGNTPASATVPGGAKYSATTKWLVGTADKPAGNFLTATVYTAEVTLTADAGYKFATTITPPADYTAKAAIADGATTVTYTRTFAQTKDTAALVTAINAAQAKYDAAAVGTGAGQYTAEVKATYLAAINAAKTVKDNANSTQAQINDAVTTLATATTTFTNAANKDTAALVTAINAAQAKHDAAAVGTGAGQYTAQEKATYLAAINAAKAVKDNAGSTQAQINDAVTTLATATTTFTNAANKDTAALAAAINTAQAKHDAAVVGTDAGQYTAAVKSTYLAAINAAKAVKDNANSTQEQINTAVTTLATATTTFTNAANADTTVLKPGDINGDGKFDIEDALVALKVATGVMEQPTGNKLINGNINKVGGGATIIDKADADALLGHIVDGTTPA